MANLVVHFEIHASEPQKVIDYYSNLLLEVPGLRRRRAAVLGHRHRRGRHRQRRRREGPRHQRRPHSACGSASRGRRAGQRLQHRGRRRRRRRIDAPRRRARRDRGAAGDGLGRASAAAATCSTPMATSSVSSRRSSPTARSRWASARRRRSGRLWRSGDDCDEEPGGDPMTPGRARDADSRRSSSSSSPRLAECQPRVAVAHLAIESADGTFGDRAGRLS